MLKWATLNSDSPSCKSPIGSMALLTQSHQWRYHPKDGKGRSHHRHCSKWEWKSRLFSLSEGEIDTEYHTTSHSGVVYWGSWSGIQWYMWSNWNHLNQGVSVLHYFHRWFQPLYTCWTLQGKGDALNIFKMWKACMEKETGQTLKILCTDSGGEYTSNNFSTYLAEHGIKCELTNTYTPQENGISKWANQTLNNLACSMIADAKEVLQAKSLPSSLWSQAVHHAAWIKNRIFTCSLNTDITPYQAYFGKKPSLAMLWLFGCKAYAHTPKVDQTKFGEHWVCRRKKGLPIIQPWAQEDLWVMRCWVWRDWGLWMGHCWLRQWWRGSSWCS